MAVKRFKSKGSVAFSQELKIMCWTGAHPHILRLLEAFEGTEDDVLVLEYCALGDVYEHYVRTRLVVSENHVAELMRQLLLALSHLQQRHVEHRDVKPENLLIFEPPDDCMVPLVKLADFGWATIAEDGKTAAIPPEGVGSLWYAAPELNPPAPGLHKPVPLGPLGSSDMWSVGVITYLLLVGHSPFNTALRVRDPVKRENEILRMAAKGEINTDCEPWHQCSTEAQTFCRRALQQKAYQRPHAEEALAHAFILKAPRWSRPCSDERSSSRLTWEGLDGFQRMSWQAIACAASEPDMFEAGIFLDVQALNMLCPVNSQSAPYVEALAMELAAAALPSWFYHTKWLETMHLAFRYLDVNMDGRLSVEDLTHHIYGQDAETSAQVWLERWRQEGELDFACFSKALQNNGMWTESTCAATSVPETADTDDEIASALRINIDLDKGCSRFMAEVGVIPSALDEEGEAQKEALLPL